MLSARTQGSVTTSHGRRMALISVQHQMPRRNQTAVQAQAADPICTIEVVDPSGAITTLTRESGEILRQTLIANKAELYQGMWAKAMNCGGAGNCGTCAVEVLEDGGLLSERTANENKKLQGKPASWRLACQTIVGDGESSGACKIKLGPK